MLNLRKVSQVCTESNVPPLKAEGLQTSSYNLVSSFPTALDENLKQQQCLFFIVQYFCMIPSVYFDKVCFHCSNVKTNGRVSEKSVNCVYNYSLSFVL